MTRFLLTAFAFLACTSFGAFAPAHADEIVNAQDAFCTTGLAEWRNYRFDNKDQNPAKHQIAAPEGHTQILSCKLGAHYVRINYLTEPYGPGDCQMDDQGYVSVWIDGVKVVDKETFANDRDTCGANRPPPRALISKIIVNTQMHLTICRRADGGVGTETCGVSSLTLKGKPHDAVYDGPLKQTTPGLDLITASNAVCRSVPADRASVESPEEKVADRNGDTTTFTGDIDNDGYPDKITRQVSSISGNIIVLLGWESGKTHQSYSLNDAIPNGDALNTLRILHIQGHSYIDLIQPENSVCSDAGNCDNSSLQDEMLYDIGSDGSARELCRWRPRTRPEEKL